MDLAKEPKPAISVIVPHYGDPAPTLELLKTLAAQRDAVPVELIVSDDCSPTRFPEAAGYRLVRREQNGGFGSAVNSAAAVAQGDYLLIINSDTEVSADFLKQLSQAIRTHPRAVLGPRVIEAGKPRVTTWRWPRVRGLVAEWSEPLARWHGSQWLDIFWGADLAAHHSGEPKQVDWLVGVCLLLPRDAFEAVGGFDEGFFMNCEEVDLQLRLNQIQIASVYLPKLVINHQGGGSSDPDRKSSWLVDSRFRYHTKWGGAKRLLCGWLAASVINLGWNSARAVAGRSVHPWAQFRRQLTQIMHGWRHRSA